MTKQNSQPYSRLPSLDDVSLVGSWLSSRTPSSGKDYSANGNDGTATDVAWGKDGSGTFNGSSSVIDLGSDVSMSTGAWTVEAIINLSSLPGAVTNFISGTSGAANSICQYIGLHSTNKLGFWDNDNSAWRFGNTALVAGELNHCGFSYDGSGTVTFYLNGQPDGTGVIAMGYDDLFLRRIGVYTDNSSRRFPGEMRELSLFSEAKSASWFSKRFHDSVPDSSLVFSTVDGTEDLSRYRNAITNVGEVVTGNSMEFDGTNYLSTPMSALSHLEGAIGLWVSADDWTPVADVFWNGEVANNVNELKLLITGNNVQFTYRLAAGATTVDLTGSALGLPNRSWHYIAATWIGSGLIALYIDGALVDSVTAGFSMTATPTTFFIGKDITAAFFTNGMIKDFNAYGEAKSAGYIKQYYLKTRGRY